MTTTTPEAVAALCERLRRVKYTRERDDGPNGTYWDEPCDADDVGAEEFPVNPDGPKAAVTLTALSTERDALAERVKVLEGAHPFEQITGLINSDPEYAWGWHCNLAVPIMDAAGMSHALANQAAALIMSQMFGHDITANTRWEGEKSAAQQYFEMRIAAEREEDAEEAALKEKDNG